MAVMFSPKISLMTRKCRIYNNLTVDEKVENGKDTKYHQQQFKFGRQKNHVT